MEGVNLQQPGTTKGTLPHPRSLGRRDKGERTQHPLPAVGTPVPEPAMRRSSRTWHRPPTLRPTHTHRAGAPSRLPGRAEEGTAGARSCWGPPTSGAVSAAPTPDVLEALGRSLLIPSPRDSAGRRPHNNKSEREFTEAPLLWGGPGPRGRGASGGSTFNYNFSTESPGAPGC